MVYVGTDPGYRRLVPNPVGERNQMSNGHYFDSDPVAGSRRREVPLVLPDLTVSLQTDAGVFSGDRIDAGTKLLLLEAPHPPATGELLDLGCGYGPIAISLARRAPEARIWAVDVNRRARALTVANAERAGVPNVTVCAPDDVPDGIRFAAVYSNPPVRIGKAALHTLLLRWLARLEPGAKGYLVVHKHLGADSLRAWLTASDLPTDKLGSRMGYRLLEVRGAR